MRYQGGIAFLGACALFSLGMAGGTVWDFFYNPWLKGEPGCFVFTAAFIIVAVACVEVMRLIWKGEL